MTDLVDIQNQIAKLQKQAGEIRSREFDKTVADILAKMQAFGITLKDLHPKKKRASGATHPKAAGSKLKTARKVAGKKTATVAPKYKGPAGETWSGRGLTPKWLASLIAQGQKKEDFLIKG
jgi:DNA-binding protein H-NS